MVDKSSDAKKDNRMAAKQKPKKKLKRDRRPRDEAKALLHQYVGTSVEIHRLTCSLATMAQKFHVLPVDDALEALNEDPEYARDLFETFNNLADSLLAFLDDIDDPILTGRPDIFHHPAIRFDETTRRFVRKS